MKICAACKALKEDTCFYSSSSGYLSSKCRPCSIEYSRNRRWLKFEQVYRYQSKIRRTEKHKARTNEATKKSQRKYSERFAARTSVRLAIEAGKLFREPCIICGEQRSEAHHEDYSRPLQVKWLCHTHHLIAEGKAFGLMRKTLLSIRDELGTEAFDEAIFRHGLPGIEMSICGETEKVISFLCEVERIKKPSVAA